MKGPEVAQPGTAPEPTGGLGGKDPCLLLDPGSRAPGVGLVLKELQFWRQTGRAVGQQQSHVTGALINMPPGTEVAQGTGVRGTLPAGGDAIAEL